MYRHLMDICWLELSIPSDHFLLSRILNVSEAKFKGAWRLLGKCFKCGVQSDRLIHPRLDLERQKQADWRAKSAEGGRRSAHKPKRPKQKSTEQGGSTTVTRVVQPKADSAVCSLQSSVSSFQSSTPNAPSEQKQGKPTKRASDSPADPRLHPMKEFIESEYHRVRGCALVTDSTDWMQFNAMLRKTNGRFDLAALKQAWTAFLESPNPYHQTQGHPLRFFSSNINGFVGARTHQVGQGRFDLHERNAEVLREFVARGSDEKD